jgi:hypothetical protein
LRQKNLVFETENQLQLSQMHLLVAIGYDRGYKNNGSCPTHHSFDQTAKLVTVNFLVVEMWCFCVFILIQLSRIACMDVIYEDAPTDLPVSLIEITLF